MQNWRNTKFTRADLRKVQMNIMIIIIDLHCDALLPSGCLTSGGGNKYSRNILSLLITHNIPFLYFTIKTDSHLESFMQLGTCSFFYRITVPETKYDKGSSEYKNEIISYIDPILANYGQYTMIFHSIYWYSGEIAQYFAQKYHSYFIHTVISNGKTKAMQNAADSTSEQRCEIEQIVYEKAKYIICSSNAEAEDIAVYYNISPKKLKVTGRIIEKEFLTPYLNLYENPRTICFSADTPYCYIDNSFTCQLTEALPDWTQLKAFLFVGRIHENKGIRQIILAWQYLYCKYGTGTPPLWIVGGTPQEIYTFKNNCIDNIVLLNKSEKDYKLIWWGTLTSESISTLMSKSLVLVTHSKYEAGGNTILEAMAHALPVIATPYGFAKDYIRHNENGYIVKYDDIESLKVHMEYFIRQPYLTNYMGRVAAKDIQLVRRQWEFENQHLKMYGLHIKTQTDFYNEDTVAKDSIDTYFDRFVLPEESYIRYLICTKTNHAIDYILERGNLHNYYLWEIKVSGETHYFYFLYSILNRTCLCKKNDCTDYIITKYQRIEYLEKECLNDKTTIYFLDKSEGYAYLSRSVENIL